MTRPRSYDPEEVVEKAMAVFWRLGYAGASVQALVEATGLERGSLYGAFGSKAGLYQAALAHYVEAISELLKGTTDAEAMLRGWFDALVVRAEPDGQKRGCLLLNSAAELGRLPEEERGMVKAHLASIEGAFAMAIGEVIGEPPDSTKVAHRAANLLASLIGLATLTRLERPQAALHALGQRAIDEALRP